MRVFIFLPLLIVTLLIYCGCSKPGCLGNEGQVITLTRTLGSFDTLVLEDNIDLVLVQGGENQAEITAGERIIPNIVTELDGRTLRIRNSTDCRWMRDANERAKVQLTFSGLSFIEYKGSGDISNLDTIRLAELRVESTIGAGDIELTIDNGLTVSIIFSENAGVIMHGKTDRYTCYTDARGQLDLSDLTAKTMHIEYGGLANTEVNAIEQLSVQINYHGNVYYSGSPIITSLKEYSTGRLIHRP